MRNLYFANLRADGTIQIPKAVISEMKLTAGTGFAIEPDPESNYLYLQIIPNARNRKPDMTAGCHSHKEGEPS